MTTKEKRAVTRRSHPDKRGYRRLYFGGYLIGWIAGEGAYELRVPKDSSYLPSLLRDWGRIQPQPTIRKIQDRMEEIIDERLRNYRFPKSYQKS